MFDEFYSEVKPFKSKIIKNEDYEMNYKDMEKLGLTFHQKKNNNNCVTLAFFPDSLS